MKTNFRLKSFGSALAVVLAILAGAATIVVVVLDSPQAMADRGKGKGSSDGGGDDGGGDDGGGDDGGDDGGGDDGGDDGGGDDGGGDDGGGDDGGDDGGGDDGGGDDGGGDDGGSQGSGKSKSTKGDEADEGDDDADDTAEADEDGDEGDAEDANVADSPTAAAIGGDAATAAGAELSVEHSAGRDHLAGEVVVIDDRPGFLEGAQALGLTLREQRPLAGLGITVTRFGVPPQVGVDSAIRSLRQSYPGLLVDTNAVYAAQSQTTSLADDHPARLLGWESIAPECGRGVAIGIIDTAVDMAALAGRDVEQRAFLDGAEPARSEHGNGTVSLLLGSDAAGLPGLVPAASVHLAAVFERASDGTVITTATAIAQALDWLVTDQVRIINLSLAGGDNLLLRIAIARAVAKGTVLVAAAGNGGPDAPPAYPAAYDGVLAVTAVDRALKPLAEANRGDYIDLAAPGVDVPTVMGSEIVARSGTSLAAPFVTAVLAMDGARLGPDEALDALASSAVDLGAPGRDAVYGWGLLHAPACGQAHVSN